MGRGATRTLIGGGLLILRGRIVVGVVASTFRNRSTVRLSAYHAGAFVILLEIPKVLDWPGFTDSLTDTFSHHFIRPAPEGLHGHWLLLMGRYLVSLGRLYGGDPILPLLMMGSLALLWHRARALAALATSAALTGAGTALAHPVVSQGSRLYVQIFLVAAFGLGLTVELTRRSFAPWLVAEWANRVRREDDLK